MTELDYDFEQLYQLALYASKRSLILFGIDFIEHVKAKLPSPVSDPHIAAVAQDLLVARAWLDGEGDAPVVKGDRLNSLNDTWGEPWLLYQASSQLLEAISSTGKALVDYVLGASTSACHVVSYAAGDDGRALGYRTEGVWQKAHLESILAFENSDFITGPRLRNSLLTITPTGD